MTGSDEKLYTYTIITTDSNKQLSFLHDRMPVMFDNGSEAIRTWLDPARSAWSKDLQSLLKPYDGELEIYPVSKEVGKVGNNSPQLIVPIDSAENKSNIANFFGNQAKAAASPKKVTQAQMGDEIARSKEQEDPRPTSDMTTSEDNAPLPLPQQGLKRSHEEDTDEVKLDLGTTKMVAKGSTPSPSKKMRSAITNTPKHRSSPAKASDGSKKITAFFGK